MKFASCPLTVAIHDSPAAQLASSTPGSKLGERGRMSGAGRAAGGGRVPAVSESLLLSRAKAGDCHAERQLIERYEPLARQIAAAFFLANGETSDLIQAARVGLWHAIEGWDPARGRSFRAFASVIMRREVMLLVTASRTRGQTFVNGAHSLHGGAGPEHDGRELSLAETLAAPARDANDPAEQALVRERLCLILDALPTLSEHERGSLRLTMSGLSHIESGALLGAGARSINNALQRARRKLSAAI